MNNTWVVRIFANLFTSKAASGLVQQETYRRAPMTDLWWRLTNRIFTSFVCNSVVGQSFLLGMKLFGNGRSLVLNSCLKLFSKRLTIFLIYCS